MKRTVLILIVLTLFTSMSFAQLSSVGTSFTMKYPVAVTTDSAKLEHTIKVEEKLRLERNAKAKLLKEKKMTQLEWDLYLAKEYYPKLEAMIAQNLAKKEAIKSADLSSIDLKTTFEKDEKESVVIDNGTGEGEKG